MIEGKGLKMAHDFHKSRGVHRNPTLTVAEVAQMEGVSSRAISALFKHYAGEAPKPTLTQKRHTYYDRFELIAFVKRHKAKANTPNHNG